MLILTDCATNQADEGCLNVANQLIKRMKKACPASVQVAAYGERTGQADYRLKLNPLFLNRSLKKLLQERGDDVLYIPFASNTKGSLLRLLVLSRFCRGKVTALFAMRYPMGRAECAMLRRSGARVAVLSQESRDSFLQAGCKDVCYLKTGVDTEKFCPVSQEKKAALRKKYGVPADKTVVLHVGHIKAGRNVEALITLPETFHVVFVASSTTQADEALKARLMERKELTLITDYLDRVEEVYQMSDVYLFPVTAERNCIDTPLSVLEAASCQVPVVCTAYGELQSLQGGPGMFFLDRVDPESVSAAVHAAAYLGKAELRQIKEYDWNASVERLMDFIQK